MTTPAETTASEVESLRATVVALDAEIAAQWRALGKETP